MHKVSLFKTWQQKHRKSQIIKDSKPASILPFFVFAFLLVAIVLTYYLFNTFDKALVVDNNGFMLSASVVVDNIKSTKDNKSLETVPVYESEYIYKTPLNNYFNNDKNKSVNLDYPLFIQDGLSIVNYNDNTNLIDTSLLRSIGYAHATYSYGTIYDTDTYNVIDDNKFILLSYENGIFMNMYDVEISTTLNNISLPIHSFLYFQNNEIYVYERVEDKFNKRIIEGLDYNSTISFVYESNNEKYTYSYETLLNALGEVFKKEEVIPEKVIHTEEEQIEEIDTSVNNIVIPTINEPEFVWIKPSVTANSFEGSVYFLSGKIVIKDPAGVILKPPTFTLYRNGKTFTRKAFASSGDFTITGLLPNSTYQIVGQYTYLDEDGETKKLVTFYSDTISTLDITRLNPINISYELGEIYSKKIEFSEIKILNTDNIEALSGVKNIGVTLDGETFYFSKKKYYELMKSFVVQEASTSESLSSNTHYDFTIDFFDTAGNKMNVSGNTGSTRTSKKEPTIVVKVVKNEVDYVTLSIDLKNEDNVDITNYYYVVTNTAGKTIKTGLVDDNLLTLTNLDPNQIFNIKIYGDYDLDDNKGLRTNNILSDVDFTTIPIASLGFVSMHIEESEISDSSVNFAYNINSKKTDKRLVNILTKLFITITEADTGVVFKEFVIEGNDIRSLQNGGVLNLSLSGLKSNTKYSIKFGSLVQQGGTVYNLECIQDYELFETLKKKPLVIIENLFTIEDMIDFDVKVSDIDGAILNNRVRLELLDEKGNLLNLDYIDTNADERRITYNNLASKSYYYVRFYADEYNETNIIENYKEAYLLDQMTLYTEEGISGKIELLSSKREAKGKNLADIYSETKWIQTALYYTVPKTVDEEGDIHIYSKNGAAQYIYDLSDYEGQIVTTTFKIRAVTPLHSGYNLYVTNYLGGTTSSAYSMLINDIPTDGWKEVKYTYKVGSYKSGNHFINHTDTYYGKKRTNFLGFYFTNGDRKLAEYEVRDFEIHLERDKSEIDLGDTVIEKGSYNNNGSYNNTTANRARLSKPLNVEGDNYYEFTFDSNYSAYIYFTDQNNKYVSAYGWFTTNRTVYVPNNLKAYVIFRYYNGNMEVDIDKANLHIYQLVKKTENISYEPFIYDLKTEIRINMSDLKNEIADDSYYVQIYEGDRLVSEQGYKELVNTNQITDAIKEIDLEENKKYTVKLLFKIRDRLYELDYFEINTSAEVAGIRNTNDWAFMQPNGNYIVLNDLDFYDYGLQALGWGNRHYYGTLDFQGYKATLYSARTEFQRIGRIAKTGVLKNMVLDVHLNNTIVNRSIRGFVSSNYGLIENVEVYVSDERSENFNDTYLNLLADVNYGTIKNFFVKLNTRVNLYHDSALLVRNNYGTIENGYVYGENVVATNENTSSSSRYVSLVQRYGGAKSLVKNVFVLSSIDFPNRFSYDKTGLVSHETYGTIENVYTVGNSGNIDQAYGPVVGIARSTSDFRNVYYYSDAIYTMANQNRINALNLNDSTFQKNLFGDELEVENMIKLGYYPHVIFSYNKMPRQEFLKLPDYKKTSQIDIVSMNVVSQENDNGIIEFVLNNPEGDSVSSIEISDVQTEILSQTFDDGKTYLSLKVYNPEVFVSKYAIRSIISRSYSGLITSREYAIGELYLFIDFYKPVYNVDDWIAIKRSLNQNYAIMADLDFAGYANYNIGVYTGKINGNNHVFKNISITGSASGLIEQMNGSLVNVYFENVKKTSNSTNSGLIGYSNANGRFENVHVRNITIETPLTRTSDTLYAGGLVGYVGGAKISNSSVSNVTITSFSEIADVQVGGMIGYSSGAVLKNVYTQDINLKVDNSTNTLGVGGIIGREASSVASIINAYSTGYIYNNSYRTGGIVGYTAGYVEECFSNVIIVTDMDYVGGIAGHANNRDNINNNLSLGSITTKIHTNYIGRIAGNGAVNDSNVALDSSLINGFVSELNNGEYHISESDLFNVSSFLSYVNLGSNYRYSDIANGYLPKLYYEDEEVLLPNQKDNELSKNVFEIKNIVIDKHADYATIVLYLNNPNDYIVDSINVDGASIQINRNNNVNGMAVIEFEMRPEKYYDTYELTTINYKQTVDGEVLSVEKHATIEMTFYKKLATIDDWQNVSTSKAENYVLVNDIDFTGVNFNTNVVFNRLETVSAEEVHTISGMNYNITASGNHKAIIKRINVGLKNIIFDNINITNNQASKNEYTNFIGYMYGTINNVQFNNLTIDAAKKNRTAIIGSAYTTSIDNIKLNNITINARGYSGAFIAYYLNDLGNTISNIDATNINVTGTESYIGGLFANFSSAVGGDEKRVTNVVVRDSNINAPNSQYVGGIAANASANDSKVINTTVIGKTDVGGAIGAGQDTYMFNIDVIDSTVEGSNQYVGGIMGRANTYFYDGLLSNTTVTGTAISTSGVGGITGYKGSGSIYRSVVENSTITNSGNNTGGITGILAGGVQTTSFNKSTVTGIQNTGGIVGEFREGSITNSRVASSVVNSTLNYAGGLIGYYYNLNTTAAFREGYMRYAAVEDSIITARKYAGGIIGGKEFPLYTPNNSYGLYFEGSVSATEEDGAGLGAGDDSNSEIINIGWSGFYEKSKVNDVSINTLVTNSVDSENLITNLNLGYISTTDASMAINYSYPDASFTDAIKLDAYSSYKIKALNVNRGTADTFRIYLYDMDNKFLREINGTPSEAIRYFGRYYYTVGLNEMEITPVRDCYIRIQFLYAIDEYSLTKVDSQYDKLSQNKLFSSLDLRNPILWNRYLSENKEDYYYKTPLHYDTSYWDFTPLNNYEYNISVTDKSGNNHNGSASVTALQDEGLFFDGRFDQMEVNNFTPNNEITISAFVTPYVDRSYQFIFSYKNESNNYGIGMFIHGRTLYAMINGTSYSSGYIVPTYQQSQISLTYKDNNILNMYVNGVLVYTKTNVNKTIGVATTAKTYIGNDVKYNSASYRYRGMVQNVAVYNRALEADELLNNYNSKAQTNTADMELYYDFTEIKYSNTGYYPINKWSTSDIIVKNQHYIPLPTETNGDGRLLFLRKNGRIMSNMFNNLLEGNYHIYASGINTINIEFDKISNDLSFTYNHNNSSDRVPVTKRVYSLAYDYKSKATITIKNAFETKEIEITPDMFAKTIAVYNDHYYHIQNNNLYEDDKSLNINAYNIVGNLVLVDNDKVYNLDNKNYQSMMSKNGVLAYDISLHESYVDGSFVKSYYNYSELVDYAGNSVIRDDIIWSLNNYVSVYSPNDKNKNDSLVINSYNGSNYEIVLGNDNKIYSYQTGLKSKNYFVNQDIVEITGNNKNDPILMVRYKNGYVLAFNYYDGRLLFNYGDKNNISLVDFITLNLTTNSMDSSDKKLKDVNGLLEQINNTSDEEILNRLNVVNEENSDVMAINDPGINDASVVRDNELQINNVNNVPSNYVKVYNNKTDKYELYSLSEIVDSNNVDVVSIDKKINTDSILFNYFNKGNTVEETIKNNRVFIYFGIIVIIILNLVYVIWKVRKRG